LDGRAWTGFDLLRIGTSVRAVDNRVMKLGLHKIHTVS